MGIFNKLKSVFFPGLEMQARIRTLENDLEEARRGLTNLWGHKIEDIARKRGERRDKWRERAETRDVVAKHMSSTAWVLQQTNWEQEKKIKQLEKNVLLLFPGMIVIKRGMPAEPMPEVVYLRVETDKVKDIAFLIQQCSYFVEVPNDNPR